jgi:hypothetical protein
MKNGDSSACLACIVYNLEVNSSDDNERLVMKKNNAVIVTIMALGIYYTFFYPCP